MRVARFLKDVGVDWLETVVALSDLVSKRVVVVNNCLLLTGRGRDDGRYGCIAWRVWYTFMVEDRGSEGNIPCSKV